MSKKHAAVMRWIVPFFYTFGCFVIGFGMIPHGPDASVLNNIAAVVIGFFGVVTFVVGVFNGVVWFSNEVIGRYEWIYVLPDPFDPIKITHKYNDELFRTSEYRLRMKVGGWWKTSRRMTTPYEGENIDDYVSYDGDGNMTIKLVDAKFTVPVSVAIRYLRETNGNSLGGVLGHLFRESDLRAEYGEEMMFLRNTVRWLLIELAGNETQRSSKRMMELRAEAIALLKERLPINSAFRDDVRRMQEPDMFDEALEDIGLATPASVQLPDDEPVAEKPT